MIFRIRGLHQSINNKVEEVKRKYGTKREGVKKTERKEGPGAQGWTVVEWLVLVELATSPSEVTGAGAGWPARRVQGQTANLLRKRKQTRRPRASEPPAVRVTCAEARARGSWGRRIVAFPGHINACMAWHGPSRVVVVVLPSGLRCAGAGHCAAGTRSRPGSGFDWTEGGEEEGPKS